jgi:hypothetical protein
MDGTIHSSRPRYRWNVCMEDVWWTAARECDRVEWWQYCWCALEESDKDWHELGSIFFCCEPLCLPGHPLCTQIEFVERCLGARKAKTMTNSHSESIWEVARVTNPLGYRTDSNTCRQNKSFNRAARNLWHSIRFTSDTEPEKVAWELHETNVRVGRQFSRDLSRQGSSLR